MQEYNPLQATALISASRNTINNNMESVASHFSGTYFPTSNLVAGMYCWRTDLNKMYQLGADLVNWTLVNDMSQGYNSVAHANRADYATKDVDGNDIKDTYYKRNSIQDLKNAMFPVGSIYLTMTNSNPSNWLGGEWQQIAGGRTILGADSSHRAGNTGGYANINIPSHTHTFTGTAVNTGNQSANHTHSGTTSSGGSHSHTLGRGSNTGTQNVIPEYWDTGHFLINGGTNVGTTSSDGSHTHSITTGNQSANHTHSVTAAGTIGYTGNNVSESNMPPYLVIYIWQRVR